jgi:hypothetical protein
MKQDLATVFLLDALEHAQGTARVYRAAVECAVERDRRRRFQLGATGADGDAAVLAQMCGALGVRVDHPTAGREIVKDATVALEKQIVSALAEADRATAESIALQCAVAADTRSLANVEILARIGPELPEAAASVWTAAASALEEGVRERLTYARVAWEQLLLRRLEIDETDAAGAPVVAGASRAAAPSANADGAGEAAG